MTISVIQKRKDGKLLVSVTFSNGVNRRKLWTQTELNVWKAKAQAMGTLPLDNSNLNP